MANTQRRSPRLVIVLFFSVPPDDEILEYDYCCCYYTCSILYFGENDGKNKNEYACKNDTIAAFTGHGAR